jgi:hypothetical protein
MPEECARQIDIGKPLRIAVDNRGSHKGGQRLRDQGAQRVAAVAKNAVMLQ